jgi:hypothetical protein
VSAELPASSASQTPNRVWRLLQRVAILLYCFFSLMLIRQKPGLSYDEALQVAGAVHMLHAPHQELTVPHDPHTWVEVFGRWFPLMTVRYTGAIKEYVCVLPFKVFGPRAPFVRMVCMLFGAIGIWGMSVLVRRQAGDAAGAFFALALGINPAYVDSTIFDAGTVSIFMASMGLLALAVSRYLKSPGAPGAFWMGAAVGFGVWMRANFVWLVAAAGMAALIVLWKDLRRPVAHWMALAAGAIVGALPLIIYQVTSRGGTFEAVGMFSANDTLGARLLTRTILFAETLLADREHRAMWNGPAMPEWQQWLFPLLALVCCVVCLLGKDRFARVLAISFLLFGAILFVAGVQVSEHHLIGLLPLAVALVVLALASLRDSRYLALGWAVAILYAGVALYWQGSTNQGLLATGGVGIWSDSGVTLASELEQKFNGRTVKFLDWGLYNPVYVMTNARINGGEIFPDATAEKSGRGITWADEIREGGVFVMFPPGQRQIPLASDAFDRALKEWRGSPRVTTIPQRDGRAYAVIVDVETASR